MQQHVLLSLSTKACMYKFLDVFWKKKVVFREPSMELNTH